MTKFDKALPQITKFFDAGTHVHLQTELGRILKAQRKQWALPIRFTFNEFVTELQEKTKLRKVSLTSEEYKDFVRYVWGDPSPYLVALSLKPESYLSHASAVFLHGLSEQIPQTIFINKEQSEKPAPDSMSQEAINRTFANKQRRTNYLFKYRDYQIAILSGKQTGDLEVSEIRGPQGESLRVTKIARTLIDICVRPSYAGGPFQILEAFRGAREKFSTNNLIATLKQLKYSYPYHQAIGFYMAKAGYPSKEVEKLRSPGLKFDFYLDYGLPASQIEYDKEWRLFFPKGF